ncbi:MAG: hypothetical protein L0Z46_06640 [Nitrospiraceae bacterium]|nr:hypothetical protein [Nitrospiraceae bacterium]
MIVTAANSYGIMGGRGRGHQTGGWKKKTVPGTISRRVGESGSSRLFGLFSWVAARNKQDKPDKLEKLAWLRSPHAAMDQVHLKK